MPDRTLTQIQNWREQVLIGLLRGATVAGLFAVIAGVNYALTRDLWSRLVLYIVAYGAILAVTLIRRTPYHVRVAVLLSLIYALALSELSSAGLSGTGRTFLLVLPILAAIFWGTRAGIVTLTLSFITMVIFGWIIVSGYLVIPVAVLANSTNAISWIVSIPTQLLVTIIIMIAQAYLIRNLERALDEAQQQTEELRALNTTLDERVIQRTRYLEATVKVARDVTTLLDLDTILSRVVTLINEQFGFYHTSIFLLDPNREWAVLEAAAGVSGLSGLKRGLRLRVGGEGMVSDVTCRGIPRITGDVQNEPLFLYRPELPETRSEATLPLRVRGQIIGALDVQSTELAAFSSESGEVLQALADQLAVAIENARLLRAMQQATRALDATVAEILAATTQQVAGASEQSAVIAQTVTTVDEIKTIAEQSVAQAQEVANTAQRTVAVSHTGQQTVQNTVQSIEQIKEQTAGIAEKILILSEQTQQISEIIATVNDIASQSNILALNAAIEAARAGEHGKGFAVVAAEVRNLAAQSRQATAQVKAILTEIQKATNTTVMATEEGAKGVDRGVQLAAQTGEAIRQLAGVIEESAQAAIQMVAGGRQQAAGIEQIALAIQNINQATTQSLASTRQAEKAAKDLSELAHRLSETVAQYNP